MTRTSVPMQIKTRGHDGNSKGISIELGLKREFVAERYFLSSYVY